MAGMEEDSFADSEDEGTEEYRKGGYHTVHIGDSFNNGKYVVQRKLGWVIFLLSGSPGTSINREVMDEYSREIYKLWEVLMRVLSRGLGLEDENALNEAVGGEKKEIHIRMNYYPPCPQPELVLGISPHSDPHVLTFLLHDETPGLQIRKDGNWIDVQSIPGTLIFNIADALEIISNGIYKSIEHRSLVHKDKARMSWALFGFPHDKSLFRLFQH